MMLGLAPALLLPLWSTFASAPNLLFLLAISVLLLVSARWTLLPRPLPSIPYNREAARRILGDVPELKASSGIRAFMRGQFLRHQSPIVQVFMSPLSRPWVLIGDFREAHDIAASRYREFDKSTLTSDSFRGIVPQSFVSYKAEHPVYKHSKELLKDWMTPSFFRSVSAPETYRNILYLIELWTLKMELGGGRPFGAARDFYKVILDVFMSVTFDRESPNTLIKTQTAHLRRDFDPEEYRVDAENPEEPFPFDDLPLPPDLEAIVYLVESINIGFQSPVPRLAHWLYLQKPYSRRQTRLRRGLIEQKISESVARLKATKGQEPALLAGLDALLIREKTLAERVGAPSNPYSEVVQDELFTFIAGGHDNSASLCTWWVKFMALHRKTQTQLRHRLRAAHSNAVDEHRLPTFDEILDTQVPYLEAIIDETIRCSHIVPITAREALSDTEILGHVIPKGTSVYLVSNGPSFLDPAFAVDESLRTPGAHAAKDHYGTWDETNVGDFVPDRWLRKRGGQEVYDPLAGPQMAFGGGPRGCFGRKMVYLELRIVITLLTWTFEFLDLDAGFNTFETTESSTENPQNCNVKLRAVNY
ncbi:cytochrome P450 monooxygenase [Immersiella caudata]|uniref:Cytochrome P450 monooxygenase n=1 Tax=Immersiella caudata TaxID=314043 RepID=A0AA39WW81_9PEZI|nr:cytochrome P450 monooxygenase [Immersiella caudata]